MVASPSMKSAGLEGTGRGSQRRRLGGVSTSPNGPERSRPSFSRSYGPCIAEGRSRYSQVLRFSARGAVNAVPESTSVYRPWGGRCGELRPTGSAPSTASVSKVLPKPLWYLILPLFVVRLAAIPSDYLPNGPNDRTTRGRRVIAAPHHRRHAKTVCAAGGAPLGLRDHRAPARRGVAEARDRRALRAARRDAGPVRTLCRLRHGARGLRRVRPCGAQMPYLVQRRVPAPEIRPRARAPALRRLRPRRLHCNAAVSDPAPDPPGRGQRGRRGVDPAGARGKALSR